jgi:hypothetical protein
MAFLLVVMAFSSCNKASMGDCFKTAGEKTTQERSLLPFHKILLYDNVNLVLEQGYQTKCLVETGKNLMNGITTEVNELGHLEIRNTNECNWIRSFEQPLTVYLQLQYLDTLNYMSIGNISTLDTLFLDTLVIDLFEGAGKIDLLLHSIELRAGLHYGTQELNISGICDLSYLYSAGFGVLDARNLYSGSVYMSNLSGNHMYVRASNVLEATIFGLGNIYYYDNPPSVNFSQQGKGELIHVTP